MLDNYKHTKNRNNKIQGRTPCTLRVGKTKVNIVMHKVVVLLITTPGVYSYPLFVCVFCCYYAGMLQGKVCSERDLSGIPISG